MRPENLHITKSGEGIWNAEIELVAKLRPERAYMHISRPKGWTIVLETPELPEKHALVGITFSIENALFFSASTRKRIRI